jgi:hypothetical protein
MRTRQSGHHHAGRHRRVGLPASELDDTNGEIFHTPSVKVNYRLNAANGFVRLNRFTNRQPGGGSGLQHAEPRQHRWATDERRRRPAGSRSLAASQRDAGRLQRPQHVEHATVRAARPARRSTSRASPTSAATRRGEHRARGEPELIDNLTATRGAHTFKTGINVRRRSTSRPRGRARLFTFGGLAASGGRPAVSSLNQYLLTLAGAIDPATGRPYTYTQLAQDLGEPSVSLRFTFFNVFLQDEWRVSSGLTLNAGVRYELIKFPTLDVTAPYELSRSISTDSNNIAPRVGLTWIPGESQKTVVRAGYGIYYDSPGLNLATNAALRSTRLLSYQVSGTDPRSPVFPNLLATADPSFSIVPSIVAFDEDYQVTYAHNASVQVSRELMRVLSVTVGYSYWAHRNAPYTHDVNLPAPVGQLEDGRPVYSGAAGRPNTTFRAINLVSSAASGNYHGLDVSVRRRFNQGVQFTLNYGYSRARNNGDLGGTVMDPSNLDRDSARATSISRTPCSRSIAAPRFTWRCAS